MMGNRIPAALRERLAVNPFRRPNRYTEWCGHQLLAETVCKRCGMVLTSLGPDPRLKARDREVKHTKVRTIIRETLVSRLRTNAFSTIAFEVEEPATVFIPEGGETQEATPSQFGVHRSTICTACRTALLDGVNDLEEVQQLYEADLERIAIEDEANHIPEAQSLAVLTQLSQRRVRRIVG